MAAELPELLRNYLGFCAVRNRFLKLGRLELRAKFVYPTTLLPLAVLASRSKTAIEATDPAVQGYVDWITLADELPTGRTYVPIIRLPKDAQTHQQVLKRLQDLSKQTRLFAQNREAYYYLLAELTDNIYEHAQADRAYVMAQSYPTRGLIEVSFMDDGMTIPRSLEQRGSRSYRLDRAFEAISDAMRGVSSKPGEERGYGLRTSIRIITELGGEALIVSGRGVATIHSSGRPAYYQLRAGDELGGTLVSFRVPEGDKGINLYELVGG